MDTGIDYTNPLFRYPDGSTRIAGLWDQSIPAGADVIPPGVPDYYELSGASYGTEFTREQINQALTSDSPLDLVPSTDTNGHGTFLAGIAAGGSLPEQDFTGAAPECERRMRAKDHPRASRTRNPCCGSLCSISVSAWMSAAARCAGLFSSWRRRDWLPARKTAERE